MEKQYAPTATEKKQMKAKAPAQQAQAAQVQMKEEQTEMKTEHHEGHDHSHDHNHEGHDHNHEGHDHSHDHKNTVVADEKKSEKKEQKKPVVKKEEAIARGESIGASKKVSMYICSFIKGKKIDTAIQQLEEVIKLKRAIPYKGEIPHRHGIGMMSGRYPIDASKIFITMLKGLKGNVIVNGMDLDKTRITYGSASWASRPQRAGGVRAKRTNVILKAREVVKGDKK
jgi:large subunit ribosomal protein L22